MDSELCKTQSPLQLLHITSPVEVRSKIYEDATSKMLVRLAQILVFPRDLYMYPISIQRLFNIPKQICYMDTLEKKPGPYASIFPFAICTCSPQIGAVRADIPSINRAEGRNKNSYVRWSNKTFFSSFEISFQCLEL